MTVRFEHGLGDCVYFAHQLPLYTRRGYRIAVACAADKRILFAPCGLHVIGDRDGAPSVPWHEGSPPAEGIRWHDWWKWSKMAKNLSVPPLPDIGNVDELWQEYCDVRLAVRHHVPEQARVCVSAYLQSLRRPVLLLHTHGNTDCERKNIPNDICLEIYRRLLDGTDGTIVLLDWDNRVPRLSHWRVRHLEDDWEKLDTASLLTLLDLADLFIGIDSGPLHAMRYTEVPAIGIWIRGGSPATWSLPRGRQVNIVVGHESQAWTRHTRIPFRILECSDIAKLPEAVESAAGRMLAPPRYLTDDHLAADVQLQQFVLDWQRGNSTPLDGHNDRHRSFDLLLRLMAERFNSPYIVETGCIRMEDDFRGAGYSTYVLGAFLSRYGGQLLSVDNDPSHCAFARFWTECFGDAVTVVEADSVTWLSRNTHYIDVLLLDSRDTYLPGSSEHALLEIVAAYPRLHSSSVVAFDDTVYSRGSFRGIGALGVPWLLDREWSILYSGHQTVLGGPP